MMEKGLEQVSDYHRENSNGKVLVVELRYNTPYWYSIHDIPKGDYSSIFKYRVQILAYDLFNISGKQKYVLNGNFLNKLENSNLIATINAKHLKTFEKVVKLATGCSSIEYRGIYCHLDHSYHLYRVHDNSVYPSIAHTVLNDEVLLFNFLFNTDFIYTTVPMYII